MDANGLRLWSFGRQPDWQLATANNLQWSTTLQTVRLASQQAAPGLVENQPLATTLAATPAIAADAAETWAFWDPPSASLRVAGAGAQSAPLAVPPDDPPGLAAPSDLAIGTDDVLYVARNAGVVLVDRQDRWPPARAVLAGFSADRLAAAPAGGVWALDRTAGRLAQLTGLPLRDGAYAPKNVDVFVPVQANPTPPTLRLVPGAVVPASLTAIELAVSPGGQVMVLAWRAGGNAVLLAWQNGTLSEQCDLAGLLFPVSLGWIDEASVAVLATDGAGLARQVFAYDLDVSTGPGTLPSGALYPLVAPWAAGFAKGPGATLRYPVAALTTTAPAAPPPEPQGLRPLIAVSRASYAGAGGVLLGPLDSGATGSIWHRLYLEAAIPPRCGVRVWVWTGGNATAPAAPGAPAAPAWSPHVFGAAAAVAAAPDAAAGAWLPIDSELPFSTSLLCCPAQENRSGLFTALLQRPGRAVRGIVGRYLWLYLEILGDTLVTPEVAALRIHGPRFSYRDRYLPPLYRETTFPPDADAAAPSTPPDFLERLLGLVEGALTQIEDRVAASWLLSDPGATPAAALPWLASWIGVDLSEQSYTDGQRQTLAAAPYTARLHGTLGGLLAELELATGGVLVRGGQVDMTGDIPRPGQLALAQIGDATYRVLMLSLARPGSGGETIVLVGGRITSGAVVVVEGFRLRRTFSTILGADLDDAGDPLTLGQAVSGNSFIGDTLFLGDDTNQEFLALFNSGSLSAAEQVSVTASLDMLASRVMVLVQDGLSDTTVRRLARIAAAASPAHVVTTVLPASPRLVVGVSSLIGLDTFLEPKPVPGVVTLDQSRIGLRDLVGGGGLLDNRGGPPPAATPIAAIDGPAGALSGQPFLLSALRSQAAPGRQIARYVWTWRGAPAAAPAPAP